MTYLLLAFTIYTCPQVNIWKFKKEIVPASARPVASALGICTGKIEKEFIPQHEDVIKRIQEIGPFANISLWYCVNFRCEPRPVVWKNILYVAGVKVKPD